MNIYKLSQEHVVGYDTYDSCVVIAKNEKEARAIHPCKFVTHITDGKFMGTHSNVAGCKAGKEYDNDYNYDWVKYKDIDKINVEYIGETKLKQGLILSSFNAG